LRCRELPEGPARLRARFRSRRERVASQKIASMPHIFDPPIKSVTLRNASAFRRWAIIRRRMGGDRLESRPLGPGLRWRRSVIGRRRPVSQEGRIHSGAMPALGPPSTSRPWRALNRFVKSQAPCPAFSWRTRAARPVRRDRGEGGAHLADAADVDPGRRARRFWRDARSRAHAN